MTARKKPHSFKIAKTTKRVKPKAKPKAKPKSMHAEAVLGRELNDMTTRAIVAEKRLEEVKQYLTRNILMSNIARQALEIIKGE